MKWSRNLNIWSAAAEERSDGDAAFECDEDNGRESGVALASSFAQALREDKSSLPTALQKVCLAGRSPHWGISVLSSIAFFVAFCSNQSHADRSYSPTSLRKSAYFGGLAKWPCFPMGAVAVGGVVSRLCPGAERLPFIQER